MATTSKHRLLKILLADDGSLNMRPAIQLMADLPHDRECKVTSLRVFTARDGSEFSSLAAQIEKINNLLKSRHFHFHSEMMMGSPADKIIEYAREHSPDLIVMGAKNEGKLGGLLGSVSGDVIHAGSWPVLIVRGLYSGLKRTLLVTDGSQASEFTCDFLGTFPLPAETSVDLMNVVTPVRAEYIVEPSSQAIPTLTAEDEARINHENMVRGKDILERASYRLGQHGLEPKKILRVGDTVEQILNYIKEEHIDLLVCGSRGAGNLTGLLLGSVSRELAQHAPCSVLVVRSMPSA